MPIPQLIRTVLETNRTTRSVARKIDKWTRTRRMEAIYKGPLFTTPVDPQPSSRLLTLPSELRQLIYAYVFHTPRPVHQPSAQLVLLQTCRLIHGEAYVLAFHAVRFFLQDAALRTLSTRIWTLGPRKMHLRRVHIVTALPDVDHAGRNNPFLLAELPLAELTIEFTQCVPKRGGWKAEVRLYHVFMSALLFLDTPGGRVEHVYASSTARCVRRCELQSWEFAPQLADVGAVMWVSRARKVVVRSESLVLWRAFLYFGLVNWNTRAVRLTPRGDRYLVFWSGRDGKMNGLQFGPMGD